jgi:hypothetical protein
VRFGSPVPSFDYLVIGAGSAGCTLANRLTADGRTRVLLLEAGGWDRHPLLRLPLGWGKVLLDRMYDWGYDTEPEAAMAGRRIEVARGKVVGGSSSINAMAWVRGHRADYARRASRGLPEWSYDRVLPYVRRQESWEGGASEYRGGDGPIATRKARYKDPLVDAWLAAAQDMGYALNDDYNGAAQDGFARMQMTIRNGRRESAATAYLHPALSRENLSVQVNSLATRIVIDCLRFAGLALVAFAQNLPHDVGDCRRELAHKRAEPQVQAIKLLLHTVKPLLNTIEPLAVVARLLKNVSRHPLLALDLVFEHLEGFSCHVCRHIWTPPTSHLTLITYYGCVQSLLLSAATARLFPFAAGFLASTGARNCAV